jgi:hypothetical protein
MSNPVVRRDKHVKLQQIFIAVRMDITDDQGSRACLMNTVENSLHSGPASASEGSDIVVPEMGHLSEAGHACWMPGETLVAAG